MNGSCPKVRLLGKSIQTPSNLNPVQEESQCFKWKSVFFLRKRFLFCVPFLKGFLNHSPLSLISPFPGGFHFQDVFQSVLFLQTFVDLKPGTRSVLAHFTFSVSRGPPAGAVEKTFSTSRNRAYSSCLSQDALSASTAIFLKPSNISVNADKSGVQSGKGRFGRISVGKKLDPGSTGHRQQGIVGLCRLIQFRIKIGIALSLNGKPIYLAWDPFLFEDILEFFVQESDLPLTTGHADGCTPSTTHIQDLPELLYHFFDLVKRFSFPDNHFFLLLMTPIQRARFRQFL
jgi:hypothetical protein